MTAAPSTPDAPAARGWLGLRPATLICLVAIAVLIVPLSLLSQPADSRSAGGKLARLRVRHKLAQTTVGDVDATSETVRFATLGLKPVAVALLWERVNHCKKVEDWTSLSAALEQLVKLQPHFFSVWDFQAHNLSFNISVEFDDYRHRYAWVIKGIEFLRQGIGLNNREPRLLGQMGWFIGQKIGKADEKKQYRRLFQEDNEFHERDTAGSGRPRTLPDRDNWRVAREKYRAAQRLVDVERVPLRTTPLIFHNHPMMMAIHYAQALEEEAAFTANQAGTIAEEQVNGFKARAREAWQDAGAELERFTGRELDTSWGRKICLNQLADQEAIAAQAAADLEKLLPGARADLEQRRREALSAEQRAACDTPAAERTEEQQRLADAADAAVRVGWPEVARQAPNAVRREAVRLAQKHDAALEQSRMISLNRDTVNLDFWEASCRAEVTEPAITFRMKIVQADDAYRKGLLQQARTAFEEAFAAWRQVLDGSPVLRDDPITISDMADHVDRYRKVLEQLDEPLPQPFILQDVLDKAGRDKNR